MPAPDVYEDGGLSPFSDATDISSGPYRGVLYATDRAPLDAAGAAERFYANERCHLLRLGIATIELGENPMTWEEARRISLEKTRTESYPLKVTAVEEFGILDRSFHPFVDPELAARKSREPARRFAELVNAKLAVSRQKDVFLYVHGYKVVFDNPVLVTTELWHYLGYEGVAIAFAWPSTPSRWAYFADAETTDIAAHHFGVLLEYLAEETDARRIHIIGYSQGTRVVGVTLHRMALKLQSVPAAQAKERLRIGNVVLIGSDIDREVMAGYIVDGLLNIPDHLTIYLSASDRALGLSQMLLRRKRLGQLVGPEQMKPHTAEMLRRTDALDLVNVTEAKDAATGNGHAYFRSSPWASSDMLAALRYGLSPGDRGLVLMPDVPVWTFPPDYIVRLRQAIVRANPSLRGVRGTGEAAAE
jgi:esterase/lipase superfamily enzyme